ncbi:cache domain-containing protein [Rhizobium leucaenae]|uniref:histidine kinase n=1 Tax=Rhizobium leucaenae TaxID=29450 RepID=A0A7W6ZUC4_9HYPH|nr:cache domain-containing protein [Rhizobium leucaenae]MBB4568916.1 two-component system NarL family sensor kinase [Rhizobium leucaenae]MBB6302007.1 two-component system NarL family sensor kinase [Rhizobium leucaenae]
MSLRHQIIALAIIPLVVAILAITSFITWQSANLTQVNIATFEQNMLKSKETEILNLTHLAVSAIQATYGDAAADDQAAKEKVAAILASLDYGKDGYFFVYDYDGNNIVHPRQSFRPGRNWLDLTDPNGDKVIAELIATAKAGGGLHQYEWQKPSSGQVADKLSFVVGLDKWRWVLGTGVYLDDVYAQTAAANASMRASIKSTFIIVAMIAVPAVIVVFTTCMLLTFHERRMADGRLKELTQRVIDTQEEERARLARELHDGVSQNLVGVRYAMDLAGRKVRTDVNDAALTIERGVEALNGAIKEIRRLSHDLRPRVLDDMGLTAALEALCHNFQERSGIATEIEASGFVDRLRPEASTALYRVAQEAFNNVERHSGASRLAVRLWSDGGRARMIISDNGTGFGDPKSADAGGRGLGLRNMQERMAHFRGLLLIDSTVAGTTLTAMMPKSANLQPGDQVEAA